MCQGYLFRGNSLNPSQASRNSPQRNLVLIIVARTLDQQTADLQEIHHLD